MLANVRFSLAVALPLLAIGCGGSDQRDTAPVRGTVTFDGEPVSGGQLSFAPTRAGGDAEPGKAGAATIDADGGFFVSTYAPEDGAVVGTHAVSYIAPPAEAPRSETTSSGEPGVAAPPPTRSPYEGLVPKTKQVTVEPGGNEFRIELIRP
ncbi:hypothetical protein [Alienimonas chondri]|uniref:Carboxypeptidase regulatory-like domain-containing protein n=1 Tax=Alienimonas chondri TaxID=2681879 RepID=A0ABX1V7U8_9PLAN|nr:hypothetical protein [Alienimonas chondri]NNJ24279.1 hypothetical protein [Alienimonas chondri]